MPKKRKARGRKPKKQKDSGQEKIIKGLEKEKIDLQEKTKNLLQIIETISKSESEPESEEDEKETEDVEEKKSLKEKPLSVLKKFDDKIKKRLEENKSKEDLRKDVSKMIKESVDSKFSKLSEDLKKISDLEGKINKLAEKATMSVPTPSLVAPEAYEVGKPPAGTVSKGLAAFGEEVDLQTELLEIKKSITGLNKNLENLKKKTDYSITSIEEKIKILEKVPMLEEKFQTISEKLGPDNVQKLRKLIFSADELVDEVIPDLVGKKMRARMEPAVNEIRSLKHNIEGLRTNMNHLRVEILNLQKMKEEIKTLEMEKDRIYKEIIGRDMKFHEGVDILKENIKKRMETLSAELSEKIKESHKLNHEKIEKDVNKIFSDVIQLKLSEMEKSYTELNDRVKKLDMVDEKLNKKISELKAPEKIKKWVGDQLKIVYDQTIPEIKSIKKETLNYSELMKSLKEEIKSIDASSLGVSKTTEVQKEKIEKLVTDKKNLAKTIEDLKSEIRVLDEKFLMEKERISGLEGEVRARETEFSTDLDKQKSEMADFRLELVKMIDSSIKAMKGELEEERMEDIKNQTNELKSDIMRIQNLKSELEEYKKRQEAKFDELTSDLKNLPPDIKTLGGRIESMEILGKKLNKEKINESEFSSIMKLITKRMGEIEDHFDEIEDKVSEDKSRIEKTISDLLSSDKIIKSAQELIGKDIEGKIQDLTSSLSSDITSLSEKLKTDSDTISYLKEKYNVLDSLTMGVPKRLESQEILINKVMESKESLAKKAEAIAAELKSLSGNLSAEKDRLVNLEQKMTLQDKANESKINEISNNLANINESIISDIDAVKAKVSEIEALGESLKEKSISESEFVSTVKSISKRIDDIENLYTKLDKQSSSDKTKLQAAINQALSDERVLKSAQESIGKWMDENIQDLSKKVSSDMETLSKKIEEKSESLNKKLYSDMEKLKGELDEQSESMLNVRGKLSVLDSLTKQSEEQENVISRLKEKVQLLNSLTKDFPKKFDQQTNELKDLMGSSGFLTKRIDSLDGYLNNLNEKTDSGSERLTILEKDFKSDSKSLERRLDGLDKSLASIQSSLQSSSLEIGVLKERLGDMEKRFDQSVKKSMEEKHLLREEMKKQGERVGRILRELRE